MGGMASNGNAPGQNRLLLDRSVLLNGGVGVVIRGPVAIRSVVSQGCRPIGEPMVVTQKSDRNIISELGRRPMAEVVKELFERMTEAEQDMMRGGLHIAEVINEYQKASDVAIFSSAT